MDKILKAIDGKKTYIVAGLIGVAAVLNALGIAIPEYAWLILNALGFGAVRDGINKSGN